MIIYIPKNDNEDDNSNKSGKRWRETNKPKKLDHWDYTTMRIRDRKLKLIATYRWKIDPADMTKIVNYVWLNGIEWVIWPERNNHWHTFTRIKGL